MSRFHDEFFRQGSPEHDALMIKCTSKSGIDKIIGCINLSKTVKEAAKLSIRNWENSVSVCRFKDEKAAFKGFNGSGSYRNNDHAPAISTNYCRETKDKKPYTCSLEKSCKYLDKCQLNEGITPEKRVGKMILNEKYNLSSEYETEVIVRNGHFIIGYADAVIKTVSIGSVDIEIEEGWTWKGYDHYEAEVDILIEAKPTVSSIGEVIRQIKTYRDILQRVKEYSIPMRSVITTYTKLDEDELDYLQNESIDVVVFEAVK